MEGVLSGRRHPGSRSRRASTSAASLPMKEVMRTRAPLRCVQATAAAATARFRLWTDPAESDYEGSLDFKTPGCRVPGHAPRERARAADGLAARRDVPARAGPARLDAPAQLPLAPGQLGPVRRARRRRGAAGAGPDRAGADAARRAPAPRRPARRRSASSGSPTRRPR